MRAEVLHFLNRVATVRTENAATAPEGDGDLVLHEVRFPTGVVFTVYITAGGTVILDRVEAPERVRGRGLLRPTFSSFLAACRASGAPVSLMMRPHEKEKVPLLPKLSDLLERAGYRLEVGDAETGTYRFSPGAEPRGLAARALTN